MRSGRFRSCLTDPDDTSSFPPPSPRASRRSAQPPRCAGRRSVAGRKPNSRVRAHRPLVAIPGRREGSSRLPPANDRPRGTTAPLGPIALCFAPPGGGHAPAAGGALISRLGPCTNPDSCQGFSHKARRTPSPMPRCRARPWPVRGLAAPALLRKVGAPAGAVRQEEGVPLAGSPLSCAMLQRLTTLGTCATSNPRPGGSCGACKPSSGQFWCCAWEMRWPTGR